MSKENAKIIHQIYGWMMTALIIVLGIALIVLALQLYLSDPDGSPYSRETIANQLLRCSVLIAISGTAIVGGFIVNLVLPPERRKPKAHRGAHANVKEMDAKKLLIIRTAIVVLAGIFIVIGIYNDSARDVLTKAIKICTECIGLG